VGLTAHYTAKAWHALGVPEAERFVTMRGRLLFAATAPLRWLGPRIGLDDPLFLLLSSRHLIIEQLLDEQGLLAFLELASGLSPRGAARTRDPRVTYVEVDLPHVIALKERLLGKERGAGHHLLPGDAIKSSTYDAALGLLGGRGPIAVVAEGLNAYLPRPALVALLGEAARFLREAGGGVLAMELNPAEAVGRFGLAGALAVRGIGAVARSPLYLPVRDEADARELLESAGFESVVLHDPATHPATAAPRYAACRGVVLVAEAWIGPVGSRQAR
jgi:O-methyltransferase involved in polyketide biosynthesis